ncbi:MAG TPA: hypothetical protein VGQ59_18085 [Cyclobacteriaceae bacterium]|jgi:hypothetical protein|nr:hypothetical protein [Cyclobacteriaceae bacterium]
MSYKLSVLLVIFFLFTAETCEFHHRPDPPYNFMPEKRSGIAIFCYSIPTFQYDVIYQGKLKGANHKLYVEQAVNAALEHKCDAVFIYLEGYSFHCIKFTEIRADLIETLPGDSVRALKDDDRRYRDIDIYCYSKPSRKYTVQYHGPFTETLAHYYRREAVRKSMEFDSDAVILNFDNETFDCIKYDEVKND